MRRFAAGNKSAVYLNHRELINESYNRSRGTSHECYELKEELFYFEQREKEECPSRKRKRKHPQAGEPSSNDGSNEEQRKWCQEILQEISQQVTVKAGIKPPIARHWEETREFPQFNGANATDWHQLTKFGEHTYLIPPKCVFFNYDVRLMTQLLPQLTAGGRYDFIVLDPPWRNKYIRRLKKAKHCLAYSMLDNAELQQIPLHQLTHRKSVVAIWCTNSELHNRAVREELLPAWQLRAVHRLRWYKLNTSGELIGSLGGPAAAKQPYEMLYLCCHKDADPLFGECLKEDAALFSVPSIVHSHKPPLLPWLQQRIVPQQARCLEVFARYLQPEFTSIGLEVVKLCDSRLYDVKRAE